ncbi:MAG: ATP-binding protein [Synergistaceae bacterium]|nr:ATP-binding protein [Synergistaceae bacterium]
MQDIQQQILTELDKFEALASDGKNLLIEISGSLEQGYPPNGSMISNVSASLNGLRQLYEKICSMIAAESPNSEILTQNMAASELRKLAAGLNENVEHAKNDIKRFMRVRSDMPSFDECIKPVKEKAAKLLRRLEDTGLSGGARKSALNEAVKYQKILAMLDTELNDETFSDTSEMMKAFPPIFVGGVIGRCYYIGPEEEQDEMPPETSGTTEPEPKPEPEPEPEPETISGKDTGGTGEMLSARTPVKYKKPGASVFTDDIIKPSARVGVDWAMEVREIINTFTHFGIMTIEQAFKFRTYFKAWHLKSSSERKMYLHDILGGDTDGEISLIRNVIEWLERRKAASVYQLTKGEYVYCLTVWTNECLSKKDIRKKFSSVALGNVKFSGSDEIEKSRVEKFLHTNELILRYLEVSAGSVITDRDKYMSLLSGLNGGRGDIFVPVFWEGTEYKCRLLDSVREAESYVSDGKYKGCVLAVPDESPDEVREILSRLDDDSRDKIFVVGRKLYRGLSELPEDSSDDDGEPEDEEPGTPGTTSPEDTGGHEPITPGFPPEPDQLGFDFDAWAEADTPTAPVIEAAPEPETLHAPDTLLDDGDAVNDIRALLMATDRKDSEIPYAQTVTALLTAKAASLEPNHEICAELYGRLSMAVPIMPDTPGFNGANLAGAFHDSPAPDVVGEGLMIAAYLNAMISPEMPYSDFELKTRAGELSSGFDEFFPSYREMRKLFSRVADFYRKFGTFPEGFLESLNNPEAGTDTIEQIKTDALAMLNLPAFNKEMKMLPPFTLEYFGQSKTGWLYPCLKDVSDDNSANLERVREYVEKFYDPSERITGEKLRDDIDTIWAKTWRERTAVPSRVRPLISNLRTSVIRAAFNRLKVMHRWITLTDGNTGGYDKDFYAGARNAILSAIDDVMPRLADVPGKSVTLYALERMRRKLDAQEEPEPFAVLLTNGIIPIDGDGYPILGSPGTKYYEPWRNVSKFRNTPCLPLSEAERCILYEYNSPMFENLHQLELIRKLRGEESDLGEDEERAREAAKKYTDDFRLQLMTDYAFGRISEEDTETFSAIISGNIRIMDTGDFGCWRQFLNAVRLQADDISAASRARITGEIRACIDTNGESPELREAMALAEAGSLNAAEACMNRYESAKSAGQSVSEIHTEQKEIDGFRRFMAMFGKLYDECDKSRNSGKALKAFGRSYLEDNPPEEWLNLSRKLKDERSAILDNWPNGMGCTTPEQIRSVINGLGFSVDPGDDAVRRDNTHTGISNMEIFTVRMKHNDGRTCTHPIAKFGTRLDVLSVFVIYGSIVPGKITDTIMNLDPGASVLLVDYHVNIPSRNQFVKAFRNHYMQDKYFLMVDRVLALFMALQDMAGRLPVLLQCTLPYTSSCPFTKGSGFVAPEMFYGRERELADIRSPNGSSIVYGGRQLGKTSLLKRAETLEHQPSRKRYAVYNDLIAGGLKKSFENGYDEAELVRFLTANVNAKVPGLLSTESRTLQDMCGNIEALISSGEIDRMMLLLDEADAFLEAIRDESYEPLRPLVNLRNSTENKFRFVLAGLHNVMRAKNSASDNNPLGQLGSALCIRPLSPYEARRLLLEPLNYLGFSIDHSRHLETILTATNYYPGVIQYFGYTLLEKFTERCDNAGAEELSPPFDVDDSLLGGVIGSQELTGAATHTLKLSLGLDKYFMLGQCIAYLYYTGGGDDAGAFRGYSVNDIAEADAELTQCMTGEPYESYDAMLREMSDMGILSRLQNGNYRFRRHSFIRSVWPDEDAVLRTGGMEQ